MLTGGSAGEGYGDRTARFEGVLFSSGLAHAHARAATWAFLYRLRHRSLPAIKRPARAQKANCVPALVAAATPRARPRRQEPHAGLWSEEDLNALGA
jgi:hypothetical protein